MKNSETKKSESFPFYIGVTYSSVSLPSNGDRRLLCMKHCFCNLVIFKTEYIVEKDINYEVNRF
jgi:hypothetical protein